jgi:protein-glutamine gamma-glutamyltransferase
MTIAIRQSRALALLQGFILVAGASFFLVPIATTPGLIAALAGISLACLLSFHVASQLKVLHALGVSAGVVLSGVLLQTVMLSVPLPFSPGLTLTVVDVSSLALVCVGGAFAVRLLSARVPGFSVVEFALVVASVAHAFAAHRHERIHQPRALSDFAWMNGVDPKTLLAGLGVGVVVLAALLLLRARKGARAVLALALLLLFGVLTLQLAPDRPVKKVDDNDLGLTKGDEDENDDEKKDGEGNGGGGSKKPPDPVAIVLLQDELPETPVLYFRQAVRSRLVGDKLEQDDTGKFDLDVPSAFPTAGPVKLTSPQSPGLHQTFDTSMFLLVDHAQLPGLGHPSEMQLLENPDPRRFVTVYSVKSSLLTRPIERLFGRQSMPETWTEEERAHYTAVPNDPRYRELSDRLVREVDPRFVGDDVMKAFALKQYLEKKGFYSLKQKQLVGDAPTAQFLFGDMKGYCVHFAHAAVFLLRSQGIPARVALGYGVQTQRRGAGSAVLIYGHDAHAWPELYLDGVGWVTFDISPEASDEPPRPPMEQEMEVVFGELARKEPVTQSLARAFAIPWGRVSLGLLLAVLLMAYGIKLVRRLAGGSHVAVYRAVLDRLADIGAVRHYGESRERHASRLAQQVPSFEPLTTAHLRLALRGADSKTKSEFDTLARATRAELRANTPWLVRARGFFNPIGWWFTR